MKALQKISSAMGAESSKETDCAKCGEKLVKFKRHECRRCHHKICVGCAVKDQNDEWVCKNACPIQSGTSAIASSSQVNQPHEGNHPVVIGSSASSASQASVQSGALVHPAESVRKVEGKQATSSSNASQLVQTNPITNTTTTSKSGPATVTIHTPGSSTTVTTSAATKSVSTTSSSVTSTNVKTSVFTASESAFVSTIVQTETEAFVLRTSAPILENAVAISFETQAAEVPLEPINAKEFAESTATKTEEVKEVLTASVISGSHKEVTVRATHLESDKAVTAVTTTVYALAPAAASKEVVSEDIGMTRTEAIKEVLTDSIIASTDREIVVQSEVEKATASTAVFALAPAAASKEIVSEDIGVKRTEKVADVLTASIIAGSAGVTTVAPATEHDASTAVFAVAPAAASKEIVSEDIGVKRTEKVADVLTASIIAGSAGVTTVAPATEHDASTAVFAVAPAAASKVIVDQDAGVKRTEKVADVLTASIIAGSAGVTTVAPATEHDASTAVFAVAPAAASKVIVDQDAGVKRTEKVADVLSSSVIAGSAGVTTVAPATEHDASTAVFAVAPAAILGAALPVPVVAMVPVVPVVMHLGQTDVKEEHSEDLRRSIIPLEYFTFRWLLVSSYMRRSTALSEEDRGPMHALHVTLILLKNLYYLDHFLQAANKQSLAQRWLKIRNRICVGLVKDTKQYGNTSVSMGAASTLSFAQSVGILNCGTGGIKYQLYTRSNGILYLQSEYKPKNGVLLSALNLGGYKPRGTSVSLQEAKQQLSEELKQAPWAGNRDIPVYAFVTGLLRQHWEEKSGDRAVFETTMEELFSSHNIKKFGKSYFLPQDEEGRLELVGSKSMYDNLTQAALLDKGTSIVGSFGIGRGTCQWTIMGEGETSVLIGHNAGMGNLPELANVSTTIISAYASDEEKARVFIERLESVERPVIALKSGCVLLLENKSYDVKTQLLAPPRLGREVQVQVARNKTSKAFPCTWRGSLALFCAEAGFKVDKRAGEEMEVVFRANGQEIVDDDAVIEPNAVLFVAPLNESFSG